MLVAFLLIMSMCNGISCLASLLVTQRKMNRYDHCEPLQ